MCQVVHVHVVDTNFKASTISAILVIYEARSPHNDRLEIFLLQIGKIKSNSLNPIQGNTRGQNLPFLLVFNGTKQFLGDSFSQELHTCKRLQTMREGLIPRKVIGDKAF